MSKIVSDLSMSLDGFITGPNVREGQGMGDGGDRLHDWGFDPVAKTETDAKIWDEKSASTGAVIMGKRMFDVGFEPWGDPPPFRMPVFIVTHEEREPLQMLGGMTYTSVPDGIEGALSLAHAAAGSKNVGIWGGANIIRQALSAGLLDEMQIHLIPVLLGDGIRLFEGLDPEGIELRKTSSTDTPTATHFRFEVVKRRTSSGATTLSYEVVKTRMSSGRSVFSSRTSGFDRSLWRRSTCASVLSRNRRLENQ